MRCFFARKELKQLKIRAKTVEHQRSLNKGLENKIISMQQKISEMVSHTCDTIRHFLTSISSCFDLYRYFFFINVPLEIFSKIVFVMYLFTF